LVRTLWLGEDLSLLAQRLLARARRIGDLFATGQAYRVTAMVATHERHHEEALEWYLKTVALFEADGANNPHITGYCHQYSLETLLALGRFAEARRYATRFEEVSATQSPAHLAHAVAWWVQIEILAGERERVRELEERVLRVLRAVRWFGDRRAGVTTVRALLYCAAARAQLGDTARAARLAKIAAEFGDDSDARVNAPWLRLAIARHDLPEMRRLFASNHLPPDRPVPERHRRTGLRYGAARPGAATRGRQSVPRDGPAGTGKHDRGPRRGRPQPGVTRFQAITLCRWPEGPMPLAAPSPHGCQPCGCRQ
jgi:tetratricopeptide (TPR) repeat protein